jgi:hypothetical protein
MRSFTLSAHPHEDRLRIDAVNAQGEAQAIWITRSLADKFIPALTKHAEQKTESGLPAEIALSFSQAKLRVKRAENPSPPVRAKPMVTPWLCHQVRIGERPNGLIWSLTNASGDEAFMILTGENVRALLDIFINNYRKLGWTEDAFPDWIRTSSIAAAPHKLN